MADAPLTIGEVVRRSAQYFAGVGAPSPRLDADLVIAHALGLTRLELYTEFDRPLTAAELAAARALVARRGRREPMAYILGHRAFRRLDLEVSPAVLVPRPETEVLVEWVLELVAPGAAVLDWGTGSGAIALALADEGPDLVVTGDRRLGRRPGAGPGQRRAARARRSSGAARTASPRWRAVRSTSWPPTRRTCPRPSSPHAPPELGFEPRAALVGGPRGDEAIARIAAEAGAHLRPGGVRSSARSADARPTPPAPLLAAAGFADIAGAGGSGGSAAGGDGAARLSRRGRLPGAGACTLEGYSHPTEEGAAR